MLRSTLLLLGLVILFPLAAEADTLQQYSQKCDAAVSETVPAFDCDAGTLVPETNQHGSGAGLKCDRPNVLNHVCDPGSRFQLLLDNANASIVAHCRKKMVEDNVGATDDGKYGDIAVIQYGKKNGATCFYQALSNRGASRLPAKMPAPSTGSAPWLSPASTAAINCGECHDNGPFIRSPYIAQLKDIAGNTNILPGSHDASYNDTQPYGFVGDDFSAWKLWKVEVKGNTCNDCHRMGVSNLAMHNDPMTGVGGAGTARVLGIIATAQTQAQKNPHSTTSPIWMTPGQITFDQGNRDSALAIRACAVQFVANKFNASKPLPAGCTVTKYAGHYP